MMDLLWLVAAVVGLAAAGWLVLWLSDRIEVRRRHLGDAEPLRLTCLVPSCEEPLERCTTPEQEATGGGVLYCGTGHCWLERRRSIGSEIFRYSPGDCRFAHQHTQQCWDREESYSDSLRHRVVEFEPRRAARG